MDKPLPTGATIGILGGGQLGRMLSVAAARLGFRSHIFEPGANCSAGHVTAQVTTAAYTDADALRRFAEAVDVVTYEFENVPTSALDVLEQLTTIRPGREALRISQDRLTEKDFLNGLGLKTAPYAAIDDTAALRAALKAFGTAAILKTRRLGYDGKGQCRLQPDSDPETAIADMAGQAALLEGFVVFTHEVSVIGARGADGAVCCFDPGENVHRDGILRTTTLPARLSAAQRMDAVLLTANILNALDYVGVMGVELFVTTDGLIVNEIAPRVHNSGHWTQNGCVIDQFEQHIRAIAGWSLGDGTRHCDVVMENLIGDDVMRVAAIAKDPTAALHLYGKATVKPGRKMGHVNRIVPTQARKN